MPASRATLLLAFRPVHASGALSLLVACVLTACGGGGGGGSGDTHPGTPPPTTSFSGTVTYQGAPLAGVKVVAFNTNSNSTFATTTTDASGNYTFTGFGTACNTCTPNFNIFASKAGYAFTPVLASNPGSNGATWLWDSASYTWYLASGATVTRAGFNGQFTNLGGGSGAIFTTFNFNSVAGDSVTGGNLVAFDGSNPLTPLAASGQTVSYAAGDDASIHAGVAWPASRFQDQGDGSVLDKLTGLTWLKDASCLAAGTWTAALQEANTLASGSCGLSDASVAGQWRLPNLWELESVVDESAALPAVSAGSPFQNVGSTPYWTSTSYYGGEVGSPAAWAIRMSDGRYINDGIANAKTASLAAWAVKGTSTGTVKLQATGFYVPYAAGDDGSLRKGLPLTFPRMRDNGNGTVTDTTTGLTWLRQANCLQGTWTGALAAVSGLASGQCGLSDSSTAGQWRMPSRKEMESLADRAQNNQADAFTTTWTSASTTIPSMGAAFGGFIQQQYYWTSTTDASSTAEAWTVFSCDYGVYDIPKGNTGYTLAVR